MNPRAISLLSLSVLLGAPCSASAVVAIPNVGGDSCATRIREATADDVLLRERDPLLGAPENANNAPGPGSLRAVVRPSDLVYIVDTATDSSRRLCPGTMPRSSPDGRWIACNQRTSRKHPYTLALVDVRTGDTQVFERLGQIEDYAWSPDSKRLAFTSIPCDSSCHWNVGWLDVTGTAVHVLATDAVPNVEYSECEWAPDSRRFVVSRQREDEHDDSVRACDLWLFDIDGRPCRLTHTPRLAENFPGWIDDRRIRYQSWDSNYDNGDGWHRYVIELDPAPSRR